MSNGTIRIFRIIDYFDLWRGAFYSVMLGMIYGATVPKGTISVPLIVFAVLIMIYLISDGIVRFSSRRIIRNNWSRLESEVSIISEVWLLILEMVGLSIFAVWAYGIPSKINTIPFGIDSVAIGNSVLFGAFCLSNCFHNAALIQIDEGPNIGIFFFRSLFQDASEMPPQSERWAPTWIEMKETALKSLEEAEHTYEDSKETIKTEFEKKRDFKIIDILKLLLKYIPLVILKWARFVTISVKLGLIHTIIQYVALHVLLLHLLAGLTLIFANEEGVFPFLRSVRYYSLLLILVSAVLYSVSSYEEMQRLRRERNAGGEEGRTPREEKSQLLGNLVLITFFLFWILSLPKDMLIILVLVAGGLYAFVLLATTYE